MKRPPPRPTTRRRVLRGLLGGSAVSIALPAFEYMLDSTGKAWADGSALPRRFGIFFWGNGNRPERWTPIGEGADYLLSEELAPLADVQSKITVVSGMNIATPNTVPHLSGACGLLTGSPVIGDDVDYTFPSASIDQVIADAVGGETAFRSIELGTLPDRGLSYNGPYSLNPPESSPYALFERIFGTGFVAPGSTGIVDPSLGLRRSVLDAVSADILALQSRMGAVDLARLEAHLEGVRALELRLAKLEEDPPTLAACTIPATPATEYPDIDGRPQLAVINQVMADLLAMVLACDQTRVFSNTFTYPLTNALFPGATAGHHSLTHDEPGDQPEVHAITTQCIEAYAALVRTLDAIPEGDGTLLDNCVVLGTSDVSEGRQHSLEDYPILLAGSCCGQLKTNWHHHSISGDNASKVGFSLLKVMDVPATSFGTEAGYVTEGLSEIEI